MDNIWGIILAAGASTRMKKQKMLLPFNGKTIIETVIEKVEFFLQKNMIVVVGADKEKIKKQIKNIRAKIVVNDNYNEGMLSSVVCGLKALPESADAVLVFLGDQPHIPSEIIEKVIMDWKNTSKGILIPSTNGRRGHPLLIGAKYFTEIEKLDPQKGLRKLSEKFKKDVLEVKCNFPGILRDIDTPEEYELEINKYN